MTVAGLRERKKQKTKASIQREALRLFKKKGYDETTIEDIAEAAEISPSTFFNYFPSKEDVVIYDEYDPQIFAALLAESDEPLSQTLRGLFERLGGLFEADSANILERAKLSLEVPELRARIWGELERTQEIFAGIIATRTGRGTADFEVRVVAMALVAAAFEAAIEWVRSDGRGNILELFSRALDALSLYDQLDRLEKSPAS